MEDDQEQQTFKSSRASSRLTFSASSDTQSRSPTKSAQRQKSSSSKATIEKEVTFNEIEKQDVSPYLSDSESGSLSDDLQKDKENVKLNDDIVQYNDASSKHDEKQKRSSVVNQDTSSVKDNTDARNSEEEKEIKLNSGLKKGKKLKKVSERRTAFDGREVVFVTEFSQTDWKWKERMERMGKGRLLTPTSLRADQTDGTTITEQDTSLDDRTTTDLTPFSLQPNDEFGIPLLDMSTDSDTSDEESSYRKARRKLLPSIGPPQILKYIRESDQQEKEDEIIKSEEEDDDEEKQTEYVLDEAGNPVGMFGGHCEFCNESIKPFPTLDQQLSLPPESLYCCEEYREFVEFAMTTATRLEQNVAKQNEKINVKVHPHHGSKKARKMAKEQAVQRMRERELHRRQQEATGLQQAYYQSLVARQMKTINYQLSSQRCLEEGWTVRAPSPLDQDDTETDIFIPEPLHPSAIASGKIFDRKLVEKFYPDGSKFLTMFPDGTGNVFYPSGNLAILIHSSSLGQYTYVVQSDSEGGELLAVFEPNGFGWCNFANGNIRISYDQIDGIELDVTGTRKKSWSWLDHETHVHAPPFQPIVFGMNRYVGVRFMAQDSIALTVTGNKRSCRFNVGAKLKLMLPDSIQTKPIDETELFIKEQRLRVDTILDKVANLLRFPKSPKVDRILPPLSVTSRKVKVDKMRRELTQTITLQENSGRKDKKIQQTSISPLPVVTVN